MASKARVSVREKDRGIGKIRRVLRQAQLHHKVVLVGFTDADEMHDGSDLTVAQIAAIHEFGAEIETASGNVIVIPARSMLRATFDAQREANIKKLRTLADAVLQGRIDLDKALNIFGVDMVGQVVRRINLGIPPPNAPSTIARKGSSHPLIDTGQMKQSVSYTIRSRK